jgi:hypothetical protein
MAALRIRASKSAIGSVIMGSPARFRYARDLALEREEAEAHAAQAEVSVHSA